MIENYNEFIGIYDESVPVELCNSFLRIYEEAKKNSTIIDLSKNNETTIRDDDHFLHRRDESMFVAPVMSTIFPKPPVTEYFKWLHKCFDGYVNRYSIAFAGAIYNDIFKIHKVRKSEGYHTWHFERNGPLSLERIMVYMTYLEVPKTGGETEFLHQSLRIEPRVGRTLIWPAGFTHQHRGNPPLDGEKMYITGWFTGARVDVSQAASDHYA